MTKDCPLNYQFSTWKLQAQNIRRTCCVHKLVFVLTFRTINVHHMFFWSSDLVVFMYWTGNSINNLLLYFGLVDARIRASDKDLHVRGADRWFKCKKVHQKCFSKMEIETKTSIRTEILVYISVKIFLHLLIKINLGKSFFNDHPYLGEKN